MIVIRLLLLVIIINIARYFLIGIVEQMLIFPYLFEQMELHSDYFNTDFQTFDWVTSYIYNFIMWLVIIWIFHVIHPRLKGNYDLLP